MPAKVAQSMRNADHFKCSLCAWFTSTAALFVFFAAAAGTRIIPANLDGSAHRLDSGYHISGLVHHL